MSSLKHIFSMESGAPWRCTKSSLTSYSPVHPFNNKLSKFIFCCGEMRMGGYLSVKLIYDPHPLPHNWRTQRAAKVYFNNFELIDFHEEVWGAEHNPVCKWHFVGQRTFYNKVMKTILKWAASLTLNWLPKITLLCPKRTMNLDSASIPTLAAPSNKHCKTGFQQAGLIAD